MAGLFGLSPDTGPRPPTSSTENALVGDDAIQYFRQQGRRFVGTDLQRDIESRCGGDASDISAWEAFAWNSGASPFGCAAPVQLPRGLKAIAKHRTRCMAVRYDPSGRLLAVGHQHPGAVVATAENFGKPLQVVAHDSGGDLGWSLLDIAWQPEGRYLVRSGWSSAVSVIRPRDPDAFTGKWDTHVFDARRLSETPMGIFSVAMMGDTLIAATNVGTVFAADLEAQRIRHNSHSHALDVNAVCAVHTTTDVFATGGDDGVVLITDLRASSNPVAACFGHTHGITSLDCRGDGRYLVTNSKDQTARVFDLRNATTEVAAIRLGMRQTHSSLNGLDYRAGPPPDGEATYVTTRSDNSTVTLTGHQVYYTLLRARFSPFDTTGGRYVACGSVDGRIAVFDVVTQELTHIADRHYDQIVRDVSWHPDGRHIAAACIDGAVRVFGPDAADMGHERTVYSAAATFPRQMPTVDDDDDDDSDFEMDGVDEEDYEYDDYDGGDSDDDGP